MHFCGSHALITKTAILSWRWRVSVSRGSILTSVVGGMFILSVFCIIEPFSAWKNHQGVLQAPSTQYRIKMNICTGIIRVVIFTNIRRLECLRQTKYLISLSFREKRNDVVHCLLLHWRPQHWRKIIWVHTLSTLRQFQFFFSFIKSQPL